MKLKAKQAQIIQSIKDHPEIDTYVLIGSVGTGKTAVVSHIGISLCYKFPETTWHAWRKNNSVSRKTLVRTYRRTLKQMNFVEGEDYLWRDRDMEIIFKHNGSIITFSEANRSIDKDLNKVKGIDATCNHIDEANELDEDMCEMIESRKGRNNEYGQPSLNFITMNPNSGWAKKKFYKPYRDGTLPPNVCVIEFTIQDSWQSKVDIERLMKRSKWWVERFIKNNWEYADESGTILSSRWFDQNSTKKIDANGLRSAGVDVAIKRGGDKAVYALWQGLTLVSIIVMKDNDEETDTDTLAEKVIEINTKNSVGYKNTAVDAVGNGAGVVGSGKKRGHMFFEYVSGASPMNNLSIDLERGEMFSTEYNMLRSQAIHAFALMMEAGTVKIYEDCEYLTEFEEEAMEHGYTEDKKSLKIESKEEIKARTGYSPDIFDAVIMGFLMQIVKESKVEWAAPRFG